MQKGTLTIAEALESIELTNNDVRLRGDLQTQNAFYHHGIFYAELFDGRTTLRVAFDPKYVDLPDEDCHIEVEGEVWIYANKASLTLWTDRWEILGDSQRQDEIDYSYQILEEQTKKRRAPKKIRKVLVIGPKTDSAHAIQDFLNALERHSDGSSLEIAVRQVRMRGSEAAYDIAAEIESLKQRKDLDLYCLVSGGGDKYELDHVFSAPVLVEAVCSSRLPCLAGVGHSKDDFPLNDAAYWCADTPSAAGAMLGDLVRERKKGCYLVTAASGVNSPEVRFFYRVRDAYLAKYFWGKIFIKVYYSLSPSLALLLTRHNAVKKLSYALVIRPVYKVLSKVLDG